MKVAELSARLRQHEKLILSGAGQLDREEWGRFLAALASLGGDVDEVVRSLAPRKLSPAPPNQDTAATELPANIQTAIERLQQLKSEVQRWTEPNYAAVFSAVDQATKSLRKADLLEIAHVVVGRKNSKLTVPQLKEALARPAIDALRTRFIGAGA